MTNIHDLVLRLQRLDVRLWDDDGFLGYDAPDGAIDDALLAELRAHKDELLAFIRQGRDAAAHQQLRALPHDGVVAVSPVQRGLWFVGQQGGGNVAYNVPFVSGLSGPLDVAVLARSLDEVVRRHESLRTTFELRGDTPVQVIHAARSLDLAVDDLADLDLAAREAELERRLEREVHRPFDLERGPLLRARLFRLAEGEHVLCLVVHHIVADGWSLTVLCRELAALYPAFAAGRPSPLPPLPLQYADFSRWHAERLAGDAAERHLAHWRQTLADLPALRLPTDRPRPATPAFRGDHHLHVIDAALTQSLRDVARAEGVSLHNVLFAAFQVLLARLSGQDDFGVASGTLGRRHPALEPLIGHFFNIAVIRAELADDPSISTLLQRVRAAVLAAGEHEDLPFERVAQDLRPDRVAGQNPLAQVALSLEKFSAGGLALPGLRTTRRELRFRAAKLDLALWISELDTGLEIAVEYNCDLFDRRSIVALAARYERLLRDVLRDRQRPASALESIADDERRQLLVEWNQTDVPLGPDACVHLRFEAQALRTPDAPALVDLCGRGGALSYRELDRRADAIAHRLLRLGVGPDRLVGVCLERSADLVAALLGVLKAGGAFVVLDPEHPPTRLQLLLADTGVDVVVSRGALRERLPAPDLRLVDLDTDPGDLPDERPRGAAGPGDLAYVLYTSGSTGTPNGAQIEHRGLCNSIDAHVRIMETGPGTRHAHVLSFNFDGALAHLFVMLCAGGAVYLAPRDGEFLAAGLVPLIERESITHTCLPPTMLAALPDAALPSLHTLVVAGERCPAALVERWGAGRRMLNLYGPTEASILATWAPCVADGAAPPIGRPIANVQAYVLDRRGRLVPPGAVGELCLAGVGVGRGYHNRPELTARKFVANSFGPGRLYRTGDLVRYRLGEAGPPPLEFLGRVDTQVKIRGYRVEPTEIEHVLRGLPGVADAVVTVHSVDAAAAPRLVAYVTPRSPDLAAGLEGRVRDGLRAALPAHLVPSAVVALAALPLTLNGKIDLRALPAPDVAGAAPAEPRTDAERALLAIFRAVLGVAGMGIHDNFFELGGDSILGIQVVARAREAGLALRPGQLFDHPTVAELAAAATPSGPGAADEGTVSGPVPLTPIQQWFLDQDHPTARHVHHFNQSVLLEVPADTDPDLLRGALEELQAHHDALRLRFTPAADDAGRPTWSQECLAAADEVVFEVVNLSRTPADQRPAALERAASRLQAGLDITAGPVMRAAFVRMGAGEPCRLLWVVHHLVVDAVSWQVLLPDLATAWRRLAADEAPALPARTASFKRFSERLSALAGQDDFAAERALLAADPPRPLPLDRPGGRNDRSSAAELRVQLDADDTRALLRDAARAYGLGAHEVLLTALVQALARWTGDDAPWIDLEGHGREGLFDDLDLSRTVGWFTALYPVRLALASDDPAEALIAVKEQLRAVPRRGVGFGVLRHLVSGDGLAWPQPEVAFNYVGQLRRDLDPSLGLRLAREGTGPFAAAEGRRAHVLEVNAHVDDDHLELTLGYSRGLHDDSTIARLADDLAAALSRLVHHCRTATGTFTPSDFPLVTLSRRELRGLLERVGETGRATIAAIYPLTPLQQGMLYHALQAETASAYTTQVALELDGALDLAALQAAWEQVSRRHEALRSCFAWEGLGEPVQVVLRQAALTVDEIDWRGGQDLKARLEALGPELAARPLPLGVAPVMRMTLVRLDDRRRVLFWDSHHILMDGWSMSVLLRELLAGYRAIVRGRPAPAVPAVSYEHYLRWRERQDHAAAAAHWRTAMQGFDAPTPLVVERSGPTDQHGLRSHDIRLPADLTAALGAATDAARLTLANVIAGAWALLLARYSGQDDVLFGTVVSGRDVAVPGIESMVGLFIHMLPVRARVDEDQDVWAWLRGLQAWQAAAREHQITPLADIQRFAGVPAGTALFRSVFVYQDYPFDTSQFSDPDLSVGFHAAADPTHYPLVVTAIPGRELHFTIEYDLACFAPASVERMAGHLERLLTGLTRAASPKIADLPLLTDGEREQLLVAWNQTARDHDRGATIHGLFAAQAARTPDAPAIYHGDRVVSYAELEQRANRLARFLQRRGVEAETRIAICLDRTDAMIVALLAILKAGGAYVPIDPTYPLTRQALMAADSGAALIVTERGLASGFVADRSQLVALDGDAAAIAAESDAPLDVAVAPERLAYLIYTSGSTGQPKGVAIEHRNTVAMLHAALGQYEPDDLVAVSACASICFDYSILEIFLPLIAGGAVVLAADALALPDVPARDRVRLLSLVPSAMAELHRAGRVPTGVRAINLAGEKLGNELVQRAYGLPGVDRVYNIYGPTETTTYSTYSLTRRDATDEPTLGRPLANTRVYLLDQRLRPVPIGVPGELYIGGEGVSRGYWNRPGLTRERFVADPFGPGRVYKTGDLGRFRDDGEIEYLGRLDHQVKLRGFRVELGEIEAALEKVPGVDKAVVVADGVAPHQRLVVHWIAAPGQAPTVADLRARLAAGLPAFMVPEIYLRRDAFPLTASGKIDRRALPSPDEADLQHSAWQPPETATERALAAIWQEVLEVERVGADDNFFRLGGHSLLALTMVLRVEAELGHTISIATLFQAPTLRELARTMTADQPVPSTTSPLLLPIQPKGARPPVFCVGGFGVHASYLHPLGPALGEDQPLYGLQPLDLAEEMPDVTRMEQLAARLADLVQGVQPQGPYTLSGHSAGARLALAIALELEARGHRTALVVLDMHAPVHGGAAQDKWTSDDQLLDYIRQMKVVLGEALAVDIDATAKMPDDQAWAHIAAILERERLLPPGGGVDTLRRTIRLRERVFTLLADFVPARPYPGRVVLLSVADRRRVGMPRISPEAWQAYCTRDVEAHIVPGDHLTMIREPHVGVVAAHLRRVVDGQRPAEAAPAQPFTVAWDDPDDAKAMWLFDVAHSPAPMARLDFDLRMAPMTSGTNRANDLYKLPLASHPRLLNGFVYQKAIVPEIEPDAAAEVWRSADAALRQGGEGLAGNWSGAWLPEIQQHLAALQSIDLAGASLSQLVAHLVDLRRRVVRLWEIHFELMYPVTLALSDFDDAYRDLFPDARPLDVYELLAGFPTKTTEANLRLWDIGRAAARDPAARALVVDTPPEALLAALATSPEGQALHAELQGYLRVYGERGDDLYIDRPTWNEAPLPVLRSLREAVLQPDRDLAAELRQQAARREARLAEVRQALAAHPRPVVDEFEALLAAAQASTFLGEEHNFWIDCKITFHARRAALEVGRRLAAAGAIADVDDVFHLSLAELTALAEADPLPPQHALVAERQAEAARFAGFKPPGVLGVPRPFLPMDSALMRAMFRMNGDRVSPQARSGALDGLPGARGRVTGPARIVRTLPEAGKLRPGDVLVATATLPSWTPYFAIAAAVVTDTGGMLCHAAVVAREYGIPAVVGTRAATSMLKDGQLVEVDGDAGTVRVVAAAQEPA
ncbi:non-ribosomal peptide synthetase [Nannocystis punicea]|uniref:Amino acid adenylation domain-containing protein n=1 Tax=Nannocystis punicea TaxID=2995304 RepID=A0ABY7HBN3_9BACT|nr:non-ribosomal peptide synthetase [Nannocystis poenicansa]WAS96616.1 amino acid adenylation domain-containing protein [Nannocystis poenicansa]